MSRPAVTLSISALGCQRGGRTLFSNLSFALAPHDLMTVTGPNGAGKSTMMRIIAGLAPLESGTVTLTLAESAARTTADEPPELRGSIHYHGHQAALRDALTARENLDFATALLGGERSAIPAALERLGARRIADLPVRVLSAGQRRRIALCRLLTIPRPIWLLDEPLAALDLAGQALVAELLRDHVAAGGAALVATHQPLAVTGRELVLGAVR